MNVRTRLGRWMARAATSLVGPNAWETFGLVGSGGASGKLQVPGMNCPAENSLWVYNCLTARSEAVMQAALRISDGEDNLIESGSLNDLLSRPNRWMDGVQFVGAIEANLTVFNRAYVVPVSESGGQPDELMLLPPLDVSPLAGVHRPTGVRVPMGWRFVNRANGEQHLFELEEVIVISSFNPHNPLLTALDPMHPLKRSLQMDLATREQNLAIYLNGGHPDIALETDRDMTPDQAKEYIERWNDAYQGFGKAHKTALLYNGIKINHVGVSPAELQALEVLKTLTPQEIVSGLRTKPVMAGLMVGETGLSQGTSTEEQKVAWWSETGASECARIASALQEFLVDCWPWTARRESGRLLRPQERAERQRQRARMRSYRRAPAAPVGRSLAVWFDTSQVPELAEHRWKRIQEFDKLSGRGYPPDDLNDYFDLGLPPHPTNLGTLPFNLMAVGDLGAAPAEPARAAAQGAPREPSAAEAAMARLETAIEARAAKVSAKWQTVRRVFDAFVKPREKAAAKKWSRYFLEQRGRVLERLQSAMAGPREEATPADRYTAESLLEQIFPHEEENGSLLGRLGPLWAEQLRDGWTFFNEQENQTAEQPEFQVEDPRVRAALEQRRIQGAYVNETTEEDLRAVFRTAFEVGDTSGQLADRIDAYYKDAAIGEGKYRPLTAARTQTTGIVNEGRMLAAKSVGGLRKGWLHGGSDEPRPAHMTAQDTYLAAPIGLDEKFEVNGYPCDAPGASALPVSETANCTCMVTFVAA